MLLRPSSRAIHRYLWDRRFSPVQWVEALHDYALWPTDPIACLLPGFTKAGDICYGDPGEPWPTLWHSAPKVRGIVFDEPDPFPECIDIVRVDPKNPAKWKTMFGHSEWIGEQNMRAAQFGDGDQRPLRLAADPLDWLRLISQGVAAACWIGNDVYKFADALRFTVKIVCSNAQHAAAVYKMLRAERARTFPPVAFGIEESAHVDVKK